MTPGTNNSRPLPAALAWLLLRAAGAEPDAWARRIWTAYLAALADRELTGAVALARGTSPIDTEVVS
jgi:hypothetical protein